MNMMREGYHTEAWMATVVCIFACLHLTSGWTVLRTLKGSQQQQQPQNGILTSKLPFIFQEQSTDLQQVQEQYDGDLMQPENNTLSRSEQAYLDYQDEGPLTEFQMQILQDLLRRYLENGAESIDVMISNLVCNYFVLLSNPKYD